MHVVYIDAVFLMNFLMDGVILYATGWMARKKRVWWRLLLGSAIGAGYSLLLFVPNSGGVLFSVLAKFIFSCLIVAAAFFPSNLVDFLRVWALFFLSSFVIGGAALAANSIFAETRIFGGMVWVSGRGFWESQVLLPLILGAVPMVFWMGKAVWKRMERLRSREGFFWNVQISMDEEQAEFVGLIDTGNALIDPLSRLPVAVVEWEALQNLLPSVINEMYRQNKNPVMELADKSLDAAWQARFRFVPYRGVGGTMGMLLAFRPTKCHLVQKGNRVVVEKILVAINPHQLSGDKSYQAILPPDSLRENEESLVS